MAEKRAQEKAGKQIVRQANESKESETKREKAGGGVKVKNKIGVMEGEEANKSKQKLN